ncbi:hypothetical protein BKA70DRAFT_1400071 [Coprinopsis sp. MPI-PUGE-AT-0042]|nr:hypothetical protein BKA70DRAFT_1400071 [Coprinopsis sp. MPI-PUGE-AT-0042]
MDWFHTRSVRCGHHHRFVACCTSFTTFAPRRKGNHLMEFTVKRRRKRSAVDPCLGYYYGQSSDEAVIGVPLFSAGASSSRLVPTLPGQGTDPLCTNSIEPSEDPGLVSKTYEGTREITVNDFLSGIGVREPRQRKNRYSSNAQTRLAQAPVSLDHSENGTHKERAEGAQRATHLDLPHYPGRETDVEEGYAGSRIYLESEAPFSPTSQGKNLRLRNRAVRKIVLSESENDNLSSEDSSSEPHSASLESARFGRGKKRNKNNARKGGHKKSFGTRLFEASVATHGEPLDSLVVPPLSENDKRNPRTIVQPLRFAPLQVGTSGETKHTLNQKSTLIDPRKATPFSNASFCSTSQTQRHLRHGSEDNTTYDRLSSWKTRVAYVSEEYSGSVSPPARKRQSRANKAGEISKGRTAMRTATQREDYPALDLVSMREVAATHHGTKRKEKGDN